MGFSAEVAPQTQTQPATPAVDESQGGSNPFLAILVGILMGVLVSFALLRGQLVSAVTDLLSRRGSARTWRSSIKL